MSFAAMKKNRKSTLDAIRKSAERPVEGGGGDNRFWKLDVDKAGNGQAVIRFLPTPDGEDLPFVKYFSHFINGPSGLKYVENCPTTLSKDCPVCTENRRLWNTGNDEDKKTASSAKRKVNFISNVLVIKDPANPQNEGKTFLYSYGVKINDMIMAQMNPEFDDDEPINVFDFWEGADFKLRAKNVGGYRNYESSLFAKPSELFDGDEDQLKETYEGLHSLAEFISEDKYKSYSDLESRFLKVMGSSVPMTTAEEISLDESMPAPKMKEAKSHTESRSARVDDDDDDDLSFFKSLADD